MGAPFLGILQVPTSFHRPRGDVGNLETWSIPVKIRVVTEVANDDVVRESTGYKESFIEAWIKTALELVSEGAVAIITSCGFLATIHPLLQERVPVPVGTSSLIQIPWAQSIIGKNKKLGILTFDAKYLGSEHLKAVGVDYHVPIVGVKQGGVFHQVLREGLEDNFKRIEDEVVEAAVKLVNQNPDIGGIVLECTNIPPFKRAIFEKVGLPIWDIITLGNYLFSAALPENY